MTGERTPRSGVHSRSPSKRTVVARGERARTTADTASTDRPLVSVIVPTYGRSEFLPRALESVVDQTYPAIELLVVDDCSPVPVEETLPELPFERLDSVTILRHEENRGANAARNTGIRAATGAFVAFLDDDDYWLAQKLARQVETFEAAGPETGVVYVGKRVETPDGPVDTILTWRGDVRKDLLLGRNFNQFSSVMVRADAIAAAGLPDERFPSWQDREWFFRLAEHCEFEPVPEALTVRRTDHRNRIGGNYEEKRDTTYPLFVGEYLPVAERYGPYYAGSFLASCRVSLAKSAIAADRYLEARGYLLLALAANPLYRETYPYLLATLGGRLTYRPAQVAKRAVGRLLNRLRN